MAGPFQGIGANMVRISRGLADGTPDYGNPSAVLLCAGVSSLEWDHEVQTGEDIYEADGAGNACVVRKKDDVVKFTTFTLTLCTQDHRIDDVLGVATPVLSAGAPVGRVVEVGSGCGVAVTRPVAIIELWSDRWQCSAYDLDDPYLRTVLPMAKLTPAGSTFENGVQKPVYRGFSTANPNFDDGPFGDLDVVTSITAGWSFGQFDDTDMPDCPYTDLADFDYVTIPPSAS